MGEMTSSSLLFCELVKDVLYILFSINILFMMIDILLDYIVILFTGKYNIYINIEILIYLLT